MKKKIFIYFIAVAVVLWKEAGVAQAQTNVCDVDINQDTIIDLSDYSILVANFLQTSLSNSRSDINKDNIVDISDYSILVAHFLETVTGCSTQTPSPTLSPSPSSSPTTTGEWTQHGHDAQRTSYTNQVVETPWRWKWSWNGPNTSGGISSGKTTLPRNVQPVTGGGRVYVAAGSRGVFALQQADSNGDRQADIAWNATSIGTINSTVAYDGDTNTVFAVSTNGTLYKLNASNGSIVGQFSAGSSSNLPLPPAVISDRVLFSMGNNVYAINKQNMNQIWSYSAGSAVHTPPSYSPSRNAVIVGSADLYVHAIKNTDGTRAWRVKPSPNVASSPNEFARGWPVIAESHGYVLMKMRLNWQTMWTWNPWPVSNQTMRSNLQGNPSQQALFVLDLDDGTIPFIANIGHGGYGDNDYQPMGPQPIVKNSADGSEVVYTIIRGSTQYDGRWDSHFGEMVLDNTTVSGYQAGYVRFIQYISPSQYLLTDEQPNVSMMGNYLFGGHWMAGLSLKINDRSSNRGSYESRITSTTTPHIVTSSSSCGFSAGHYCSGGLQQDGDPRTFPAGFYIYHNQGTTYDGYWSEYSTWTASNGLIFYRSTDGSIVALESGSP